MRRAPDYAGSSRLSAARPGLAKGRRTRSAADHAPRSPWPEAAPLHIPPSFTRHAADAVLAWLSVDGRPVVSCARSARRPTATLPKPTKLRPSADFVSFG